ncbi:MAG: hypothetical protein M1820_010691, partial [Bogoriella megaspora]
MKLATITILAPLLSSHAAFAQDNSTSSGWTIAAYHSPDCRAIIPNYVDTGRTDQGGAALQVKTPENNAQVDGGQEGNAQAIRRRNADHWPPMKRTRLTKRIVVESGGQPGGGPSSSNDSEPFFATGKESRACVSAASQRGGPFPSVRKSAWGHCKFQFFNDMNCTAGSGELWANGKPTREGDIGCLVPDPAKSEGAGMNSF